MTRRYELMSMKEAGDIGVPGGFSDACEETTCVVIRDGKGKLVQVVGEDGGEPEDQSLHRDWSWVVDALNDAYQAGLNDK